MSYAQVSLINKAATQTHCKLSSLAAPFSGGEEAVPSSTLCRKSTRSTWPTFGRVHSLGNTDTGGQVKEKPGNTTWASATASTYLSFQTLPVRVGMRACFLSGSPGVMCKWIKENTEKSLQLCYRMETKGKEVHAIGSFPRDRQERHRWSSVPQITNVSALNEARIKPEPTHSLLSFLVSGLLYETCRESLFLCLVSQKYVGRHFIMISIKIQGYFKNDSDTMICKCVSEQVHMLQTSQKDQSRIQKIYVTLVLV